jgi:acyl-CoA thioesterase
MDFDVFGKDRFRDLLGVEILEVSEGFARVKGRVEENYLNFHGTAHGSFIMALADFAFALAANSDSTRRAAVSIKVNFYKPAYEGEELVAEAKRVHGKNVFFCEVKVMRGSEIIASGDAIAYTVSR